MRILVLGLLGPVMTMIVTWQSAVSIAGISGGRSPTADVVEASRTVPADSVLAELREFAVSYPRFTGIPAKEVLRIADSVLDGSYVPRGQKEGTFVPFEPKRHLFGQSGWDLELHSFAIPSLLGRAYELSRESKYIQAASRYVVDWAEYEGSLLIPRGFFFNEHAIAARSIVVTEVWRLYRQSEAYEADVAAQMLRYVQKLSYLLQDERLFVYTSNHGIMQSLSLLHLGIAFPRLKPADANLEVGKQRLLSQLKYYVNQEGVILEHSPGYHQNGLGRLAAAGRYFGILGEPVSADFANRYRKALGFLAALRRPDRTLPPIGDTEDGPYSIIPLAIFHDNRVTEPLRDEPRDLSAPAANTIAPGAGWIVLWDGVEQWPDPANLTQTVFHWANFPTAVHKHADDLGLSIWSAGQQWTRSVGHWPYDALRGDAIGWRSSNGPHWVNESRSSSRKAELVGSAIDKEFTFFDVLRSNADDSQVRRQLVKPDDHTWLVIDSFKASTPKVAELIWRFPPGVAIQVSGTNTFVLIPGEGRQRMTFRIAGAGPVEVDVDATGDARWNAGIVYHGKKTTSPAIRITSSDNSAVVSHFKLDDAAAVTEVPVGHVGWRWKSDVEWLFSPGTDEIDDFTIERKPDSIRLFSRGEDLCYEISDAVAKDAAPAREAALAALRAVSNVYGRPFDLSLARRVKVSMAVAFGAAAQLVLFVLVGLRYGRWWPTLVISSSAAWLSFAVYVGMSLLQ